jgi:hypothetical protein
LFHRLGSDFDHLPIARFPLYFLLVTIQHFVYEECHKYLFFTGV